MDNAISRISVAAMNQDMMRSRYCPGGYQAHLSVCLTSSTAVGVVAVFGLINALIGWHDASAQPVANSRVLLATAADQPLTTQLRTFQPNDCKRPINERGIGDLLHQKSGGK